MQIYRRNNPTRLILVVSLALSLSSACSSPTRHLSPEEVLYSLISIPDIPLPPETPDNAGNPAFLTTLTHCQSVARDRRQLYDWFIEALIEEEAPSVTRNDTLFWAKSWADTDWTLWVVPSDTLRYRMNFHPHSYYVEGWIAPGGKFGVIEALTWRYEWIANETGVLWEHRWSHGISYDLTDSTNGGGYLDVFDVGSALPIYHHIFEAHWDAFGHGTSTKGDW